MLNSKNQLSEEALAAWALFEAIRKNANVSINNENGMQKVFRKFAVEIAKMQPYPDKIVAGGQVLIRFPNNTYNTKKDYLEHMAQDRIWLEDAIIYPALEVLGYQPVVHLEGTHLPPYVPFVQQQSDTPLQIDIINLDASSGGTHWRLKAKDNPGGGNCGAYTAAQQIAIHHEEVSQQIEPERVAELQNILLIQDKSPTNTPQIILPEILVVRESNEITRQVEKAFIKLEKDANGRRKDATEKLDKFSTEQLVALYQNAKKRDGSYLEGRIAEICKETGVDIRPLINGNNLDQYVKDGTDEIVREELIHALAMEAWRDEKSYEALLAVEPSSFNAKQIFNPTGSNELVGNCAKEAKEEIMSDIKVPRLIPGK